MTTLTLEQAAALVMCHPDSMRKFMKSGEIPGAIKRGRSWWIDDGAFEKWLNRRCLANMRKRRDSLRAARRKALLLQRIPKWADLAAIESVYSACELLCRKHGGGRPFHVDHVVPLQGELVCGLHVYENLQILPAVENLKKHNHWIDQ